jgi:hypothetical protein
VRPTLGLLVERPFCESPRSNSGEHQRGGRSRPLERQDLTVRARLRGAPWSNRRSNPRNLRSIDSSRAAQLGSDYVHQRLSAESHFGYERRPNGGTHRGFLHPVGPDALAVSGSRLLSALEWRSKGSNPGGAASLRAPTATRPPRHPPFPPSVHMTCINDACNR